MAAMSRSHQAGDLGPLHLRHHLLAGAQTGGVDLGDRGGGDRRPVEMFEHFLQWAPELGFDHLAHGLERLGRDLVAEQSELTDQLGREDPFAGGEDLAEFDVGGPSRSNARRSRCESPALEFSTPQPVGPAFLDQPPGQDGPAEAGHGDHDPLPGGQSPPAQQLRDPSGGGDTERRHLPRQGRALPVSSHGGSLLKAPISRSDGSPASRASARSAMGRA